jgi:NADPH:quinone reductase-like Zn-dependent oxidoreductase
MRAAVCNRYGTPDVVKIRDVPKPAPGRGDVLVAVHAAAVGRTDCGMLRPHPPILGRLIFGLFRPKRPVLGMDFAGEVEAVGKSVTRFKPGDRVFGMLRYRELGAHADYVCVSEDGYIATMPAGLPFEEAVVLEGAFYAHACLRALDLKSGHKVLIYGASGAIGSAALQLAKSIGAHVTAVVGTRHLALVDSLGADRTIDYTKEKFTRIGDTFDGLLDAVGKTTYLRCRRLLKPEAPFVSTDMGPWCQTLLLTLWSAITRRRKVAIAFPRPVPGFVDRLKALMEVGKFRAVIDRRYSLEDIADAYRYVETGQKTGIVIIDVRTENRPG